MILGQIKGGLILDKPAGVATHTPDGGETEGFIEMAARILRQPLWAVHRLDHHTSGCLLASLSAENVEPLTRLLKGAKKKYRFISDYRSKDNLFSVRGRIEKIASHRFGMVDGEPNSLTTIARCGQAPWGELYEAEISTGKTHQIRIHAAAKGIPILGDQTYGKTNDEKETFPRLLLHAHQLHIEDRSFCSEVPKIFFEKPPHLSKEELILWQFFLISLDRRRFITSYESNTSAFRIMHREWWGRGSWPITIDRLGPCLEIHQYAPVKLSATLIKDWMHLTSASHFIIRNMHHRGKEGLASNPIANTSKNFPLQWQVTERDVNFDLRYQQGLSSGLFLDQRINRSVVREFSLGKRVLNLFAYTCGFSLAAALGGAEEVVSVDISSNYLEWGRKNFELNGLIPNRYEFFVADAEFFLERCLQRQRTFDLIIIDPPTFSRFKKQTFQIKRDLPKLLDLSLKALSRRGQLLVTLNDEAVTQDMIESLVDELKNPSLKKVDRIQVPYDFEFPLERQKVLKGVWITPQSSLT